MAEEEDEVDILGDSDYNLDHGERHFHNDLESLLVKEDGRISTCYVGGVLGSQGTELLNCDYNIGSQWLLEGHHWYTTGDDSKSFDRSQFGFTNSLSNGISDSFPSTSSCSDSDTWTDKEKYMLDQGLELFGQNWVQLSQFVGTKTSQQVKTYVTSQNIQLNNSNENFTFETSGHCNSDVFSFSELIDDMQIPASMEEVIAVVSTAKPTVSSLSKRNASHSTSIAKDFRQPGEHGKRKDLHDVKSKSRRGRPVLAKNSNDPKISLKGLSTSPKKNKVDQSLMKLSSGEEVIRIKKESSLDSDEDAEIEVDDMDFSGRKTNLLKYDSSECKKNDSGCIMVNAVKCTGESVDTEKLNAEQLIEDKSRKINLSSCVSKGSRILPHMEENSRVKHSHQDVLDLIFSICPPTQETTLDPDIITDQERRIHVEFFDGRLAKTPKRYLKIRNHILECWRQNRPVYVTKSFARNGLKHCGDVNCIGRIHAYLEQIGAINFGCEQARYLNTSAPAISMVSSPQKPSKDDVATVQMSRIGAMRPRKKKPYLPFTLDGDGGYTITHSETGEAIHTTVVQDSVPKGNKGYAAKSKTIKLIYCHKYSDAKPAPFVVTMNVEAILVVDLHAHSCHTEVAGLLGGTYDMDNSILYIKRALACRSNSSGVHCDMCPVSQTEASEKLLGDGLEVVGWYHSHPTFLPNPSLQDLATQNSIQQWFSQTATTPIVSFILSPYCPISPSLASQYRCLAVHSDEVDTSPYGTPYMFPVSVISDGLNVSSMLKDMAAIFSLVEENQCVAINFNSEFQHSNSLSYKQKCVESAKLHLASCKPSIPTSLQNSIIQGIMQACNTLLLAQGDSHSRSN